MSDLKAVLNSDNTIKAVLSSNNNLKAVVNNGVTINNVIDGGQYIHFDVTETGSNLQFTNDLLTQYSTSNNINIMKNGVYLNPSLFTKVTANTIQVNVSLTIGDALDILATGSASGGGGGVPGGASSQVQYNNLGQFGGNPNFTFSSGLSTLSVTNANISGNVNAGNLNIAGTLSAGNLNSNNGLSSNTLSVTSNANVGSLTTGTILATGNVTMQGRANVSGNLYADNLIATNDISGNTLTLSNRANIAGNLTAQNITSNGNLNTSNLTVSGTFGVSSLSLTNLTTTGNVTLGAVTNVHITGGTNGYVLQTDGAGNLTWTAQSGGGGGGNGTPGGSNTQIQFNDSGTFGGNANLTFNKLNSTLTTGNVAARITTAAQPNITSLGTLTTLTVSGNTSLGNVSGTYSGNGAGINSLTAANIVGTVANANYAINAGNAYSVSGSNVTSAVANATYAVTSGSSNTAGTVTTAAQPNITSTGTLSSVTVSGNTTLANVSANNATISNLTVAYSITGNLTGYASTAGTVTINAQPNITSVGTLSSLSVTGNVSAGNVIGTHYGSGLNLTNIPAANVSGTVANATYATSAGSATTAGSATSATSATTAGTVTTPAQGNITSLGTLTSLNVSGSASIGSVLTNNLLYPNGSPYPMSTYGNADVANYLPTYNGTLSTSNLQASGGSAKSLIEPYIYNSGSANASAYTNIDINTGSVWYFDTAASANTYLNVRGNSTSTFNSILANGQSISFSVILTNPNSSSVTSLISLVAIDLTAQTIRWVNGTPTNTTNGYDIYLFNILKTGSFTYKVFGSRGSTT